MATDIARQLLRLRKEVERMMGLRALNARTAVLETSEEIQLLEDAKKTLALPANEGMQLRTNAMVRTPEGAGKDKINSWREARLIIFSHHLVVDKEVFGPSVHHQSMVLHENDVMEVRQALDVTKVVTRSQGTLELKIAARNLTQCQTLINSMRSRAREKQLRTQTCAFRSPLLTAIFSAAKRFNIFSGQTFAVTPAAAYCFLLVERGHFVVRRHGKILAELTQGDVYGLPEYVQGLPIAGLSLLAQGGGGGGGGGGEALGNHSEFILVQVLYDDVRKLSGTQRTSVAALYRASAINMLQETKELMKLAFPGTWIHRDDSPVENPPSPANQPSPRGAIITDAKMKLRGSLEDRFTEPQASLRGGLEDRSTEPPASSTPSKSRRKVQQIVIPGLEGSPITTVSN